MGEATAKEAAAMRRLVDDYCVSFGQELNALKSSIQFGKFTLEEARRRTQQVWNMPLADPRERYLGNLLVQPRSKVEAFQFIANKMRKKLAGWKEKTLSSAGRSTLLKSVLAAQPSYFMATVLMPKKLHRCLNSILRDFWWGYGDGRRHQYFRAWRDLCRSKGSGGLGVRDLEGINLANAMKLGWRLITEEDSLWARILKARYFPNCSIWKAGRGVNPTWAWQAILAIRDRLKESCGWRLGKGNRINITEENWLDMDWKETGDEAAGAHQGCAGFNDGGGRELECATNSEDIPSGGREQDLGD